jgi:hypothetical protein
MVCARAKFSTKAHRSSLVDFSPPFLSGQLLAQAPQKRNPRVTQLSKNINSTLENSRRAIQWSKGPCLCHFFFVWHNSSEMYSWRMMDYSFAFMGVNIGRPAMSRLNLKHKSVHNGRGAVTADTDVLKCFFVLH